ncbi:MAG: hypothetical protein ACOCZK_04640 [Planctomycetota bacterium]
MAWRRWLGLILIGMAGVWFAGMFLVGFLPLSLAARGWLALACFVLMEVSFWAGTLIIGKQVVARWWRRRRRSGPGADADADAEAQRPQEPRNP